MTRVPVLPHAASLAVILCLGAVHASEAVELLDPDERFVIAAPAGWELFPAEELPEEITGLFYQTDATGEATGASLSVRVYPDQVHSELDFNEFVGLYKLSLHSLGLESDDVTRHEHGAGPQQRITLEYTVDEDGDAVWYKQVFFRVGTADVLLLSGKDLAQRREEAARQIDAFSDSVRIRPLQPPAPTPEPLDLPNPMEQ
jgi:hypothetical protein